MVLPTLFVIGAPKCGTTFIHDVLAANGSLISPTMKEPNFFECDVNYKRGLDSYLSLFPSARDSSSIIAFEATPWYIYSEVAAERIRQVVGSDVKFIVCVRDPVERAISMYRDFAGSRREQRTFRSALESDLKSLTEEGPTFDGRFTSYLSGGFYRSALEPWIARFGEGSIQVFDLRRISQEPNSVIQNVAEWLGLEDWSQDAHVGADAKNPASRIRLPFVEAAGRSVVRTSAGRAIKDRLPWAVYGSLAKRWRDVFSTYTRPVEIEKADIAWLREKASPLFREDAQALSRLGLRDALIWPLF